MTLWRARDCAEYFRTTPACFRDKIRRAPGFPEARYLPTWNGSRSHPYWYAEEVKAWAESNLGSVKITSEGQEAA